MNYHSSSKEDLLKYMYFLFFYFINFDLPIAPGTFNSSILNSIIISVRNIRSSFSPFIS